MPKHSRPLVIAALVILGLASPGCRKSGGTAPQTASASVSTLYRLAAPFGEWEIEVWINGEPAFYDSGIGGRQDYGGSGLMDVTPFVVKGHNFVRMTARRTEASRESANCTITLGQESWDFSSKSRYFSTVGGIFQLEGRPVFGESEYKGSATPSGEVATWPTRYTASFEVTAEVPLRWTWQDAEDIGTLSDEDRAGILTEFEKFVSACRSAKPGESRKVFTNWFPGTKAPDCPLYYKVDAQAMAEAEKSIVSHADYEVAVPRREDLRFRTGQKIVQLTVRDATRLGNSPLQSGPTDRVLAVLLYQGPSLKRWGDGNAPGQWRAYLDLRFFRKNGKWYILPPEWR
jgi:hypothetical protein